ncbi:MAG TPA: hypothetical protein HA327_03675 [Candidatus Poseidoniaceae archaeon]|nr:MAG TPA: hypothetical protein D7H81_03635 [Candidatus Poseidoniales archaeon]HII45117.1 hypothetical protein [Candidatus Poseidoniaceae archaeon]|tara:strand:- start:3319 stop:3813 length:495 start_codon:yes stop_codon:yes gene_type:complete
MRVLDTAALLYWPASEITGGICSVSQQSELERVSPQRYMLINSLEIDWRIPDPSWIDEARNRAAESGDLPRLSDVDIDVLALAIGLNAPLYTDDYRLQNAMQMAGLETHSVGVKRAKQVWQWELRCSGCGSTEPIPADVESNRSGPVKDCVSCGAPMMLKRKKR